MIYTVSFEIYSLPAMPNKLLGAHWRVRSGHAKKWKTLVWAEVNARKPAAPLQKAQVILTRHSSVEPDTDGCRGSFKVVLDALVHCGVLANDKPENVGEPIVRHEKAPPKRGMITVTVTEVTA